MNIDEKHRQAMLIIIAIWVTSDLLSAVHAAGNTPQRSAVVVGKREQVGEQFYVVFRHTHDSQEVVFARSVGGNTSLEIDGICRLRPATEELPAIRLADPKNRLIDEPGILYVVVKPAVYRIAQAIAKSTRAEAESARRRGSSRKPTDLLGFLADYLAVELTEIDKPGAISSVIMSPKVRDSSDRIALGQVAEPLSDQLASKAGGIGGHQGEMSGKRKTEDDRLQREMLQACSVRQVASNRLAAAESAANSAERHRRSVGASTDAARRRNESNSRIQHQSNDLRTKADRAHDRTGQALDASSHASHRRFDVNRAAFRAPLGRRIKEGERMLKMTLFGMASASRGSPKAVVATLGASGIMNQPVTASVEAEVLSTKDVDSDRLAPLTQQGLRQRAQPGTGDFRTDPVTDRSLNAGEPEHLAALCARTDHSGMLGSPDDLPVPDSHVRPISLPPGPTPLGSGARAANAVGGSLRETWQRVGDAISEWASSKDCVPTAIGDVGGAMIGKRAIQRGLASADADSAVRGLRGFGALARNETYRACKQPVIDLARRTWGFYMTIPNCVAWGLTGDEGAMNRCLHYRDMWMN